MAEVPPCPNCGARVQRVSDNDLCPVCLQGLPKLEESRK